MTTTEEAVNSAEDTVMRKRQEYCEGLRALAQFLEEHPELDQPETYTFQNYVWGQARLRFKAEVTRCVP